MKVKLCIVKFKGLVFNSNVLRLAAGAAWTEVWQTTKKTWFYRLWRNNLLELHDRRKWPLNRKITSGSA